MPRIPTYLAQGNAGVLQIPRVLNAPENVGDTAITQGLGELGSTLSQTSAFLDNIRRMQQQEDEKLDLARAASDVKMQMADAVIDLKSKGTEPDIYEQALGDRTREIVKQTVQSLKYKESAPRFLQHMAPFLTEQGIHAKYDAFNMKNAQLEVGTDMEIERQTNLAVSAQTQEDRDAAVETAMGLAQNAYVKSIYSKDKMVRAIDEVRTKVEIGRIDTALKDPDIREEVLTKLEKGTASRYLPAQMQYNMATLSVDRMRREQEQNRADEARLVTERAQESKQAFQAEYNGLFQRADNPQPGQAPVTLADVADMSRRWGSMMSAEDQHRLKNAIVNPGKDTPSDVDMHDAFVADIRGVGPPRTTERDLAIAREAHRIGGKGLNAHDYEKLLAERSTKVTSLRKEGESDLERVISHTKSNLQSQLRIPPFGNQWTKDEQKWWAQAVTEFDARTRPEQQAARGGGPPESPVAVLRDMVPRYQEMMGIDASLQVEQLVKLIDPRFVKQQTLGPRPDLQSLNAARDAGLITPGFYIEQMDIAGKIFKLDARLVNEELKKSQSAGKTGTPKSPTIKTPGLK